MRVTERAVVIGCLGALLLLGSAGCKKKEPGHKAAADGDMGTGSAEGDLGMRPEPRRAQKPPPRRPSTTADTTAKPGVGRDKDAVPEGLLSGVKGTVELRRAGQAEFVAATEDTKVFTKDSVRVGKDGEVSLVLWDNSTVTLTPESAITVNSSDAIKNPAPSITVMAGAARFEINERTEGQGPFAIYTPSAAVAVQGTALAVGVGLSGSVRVAVEEGKVAVTPVARVEVKPVLLSAGRVIVVPLGKAATKPRPYSPEKAGWDDWLEGDARAAIKRAGEVAEIHSKQVESLNKEALSLEKIEDEVSQEEEGLEKQASAASRAKKLADYQKVQPKLAAKLETQAALREQLRLDHGRIHAHAYLLGLLAGRLEGGVYKATPAVKEKVVMRYRRIAKMRARWRQRRHRRLRRWRRRVRRLRRAYLLHHPRGRLLAAKIKVEVPAFYASVKLRPRLRRPRIRIPGWRGPLYRRPRYRGKRRRLLVPALWRRNRAWYRDRTWRELRRKRAARYRARRHLWHGHAKKRRARWARRPAYRRAWRRRIRTWRRGWVRGPHMGMRGPHMGMRGPHMGMRGRRRRMGMRGRRRRVGMLVRVVMRVRMGMRVRTGVLDRIETQGRMGMHGLRMGMAGLRMGRHGRVGMRHRGHRRRIRRPRRHMGR